MSYPYDEKSSSSSSSSSVDQQQQQQLPLWRQRVAADFHQRRQTPTDQQHYLQRLQQKTQAQVMIRLPKLPVNRQESPKQLRKTLRKQLDDATPADYNQQSSSALLSQNRQQIDAILQHEQQALAEARHILMNQQRQQDELMQQQYQQQLQEQEQKQHSMGLSTTASSPHRYSIHAPQQSPSSSSKSSSQRRFSFDKSSSSSSSSSNNNSGYSIPSLNADELYKIDRSVLDKLPLELFDTDENDRSPMEWLSLSSSKYGNHGVPAQSQVFINRQFQWMPCRVIDYDHQQQEFIIVFDKTFIQKRVKRLSILFDDEDEKHFQLRLEKCRQLREQALAVRRYENFIESQPNSVFSPIQQSALHGIVGKLMLGHEKLVMQRQKSVEKLLIEVRDDYGVAMKRAIIDHKRLDDQEEEKMTSLHLPPLPSPVRPPYLGVIHIEERSQQRHRLVDLIAEQHYTHHPESSQVILALFKSWNHLKQSRLLDCHSSRMYQQLPLQPQEYQEYQETFLSTMRDRVHNEWRSLVINLIRDNLNNVFKLFVNDMAEYEDGELKRFLKMVTFMLRHQLVELMADSMKDYVQSFSYYQDPYSHIKKQQLLDGKEIVNNDTASTDKYACLNGFLVSPSCSQLLSLPSDLKLESNDASPLLGFKPIFVFKLSTSGKDINYIPDLNCIETIVSNLVNIPQKMISVNQIDNDVVPLLGLGEVALFSQETVPFLFEHCQQAQQHLTTILRKNLEQPIALQQLYAEHAWLLEIEAEEYVDKWFHPFGKITEESSTNKQTSSEADIASQLADDDDEDEGNQTTNTDATGDKKSSKKKDDDDAREEAEKQRKLEEEKRRREAKQKAHTLEETEREIQRFFNAIADILAKSPTDVFFKMIKVECHLVKEHLCNKARQIATKLLEGLASEVRQQNQEMTKQFDKIMTRLRLKSTTVHELADLKQFGKMVETIEIPKLKQEIQHMQAKVNVLSNFQHQLSDSDFDLSWTVVRYPAYIMECMESAKVQISIDNDKFQKQLQEEQSLFQTDLEEYSKEVHSLFNLGTGTKAEMEEYASKVEALQEKLDKAEQMVQSFNQRDALFGDMPTEYTELIELRKKFRPIFELWSTTSAFLGSQTQWMTGPFTELDPNQVANDITTWFKLMFKLERDFASNDAPKPAKVAQEIRARIAEFKAYVPIIQWLRNPGLQDRHWKKLSAVLSSSGKQVQISPEELTLSQILALDISKYNAEVEEISTFASKEYQIDQSLEKMARDWKNVVLELEAYKKTNTYILKGSDDILTLLDDHIMKTQAIKGSPYVKFFERKVKRWESRLQLTSQIMEEWLNCQKVWIYLEPIFSSDDITRQMPVESRRFGVVDAYWRKTMEAAKKATNVIEFTTETDNLLKTFQECNKMLELISKHLNEYLDSKRLAFPRFFFLSNDELLSILSQTKDVFAVQPHLSKCFDAMYLLEFIQINNKPIITGMLSAEGELVKMLETIDPNDGPKKGNVELWLKDVERVMRETLKHLCTKSVASYEQQPREKWVLANAAQITLTISQLMWTRDITAALQSQQKGGLAQYLQVLNKQLEKLVELVRQPLSYMDRLTLGALIVIDVHARDVVAKMVDDGIHSDKDFDWLAQLRYYWELDAKDAGKSNNAASNAGKMRRRSDAEPVDNSSSIAAATAQGQVPRGTIKIRMLSSQLDYQYEYLGNTTRLVITPLTDRCYRTLIGAVHLHLGGAPEGPAGTGKTETVKDLSKAIAIQCVVFNCSEALNFRSMAKFFKGLASQGAWACFDEFNRIDLEVLSVIASQIFTIQRAIIEHRSTFLFDGITLSLVPTCAVFITMNPGYAGRSELPDNLKALFRSVAMMIPDYALISEIVLFSNGYTQARVLARKIVACLRLSSEQLSSQDHYDFGMRNIKSILTAAGKLKTAMPNEPEDWLCVRAISDCNVPKFVSADIPLFEGITKDLFPTVDMKANDRPVLLQAIHNSIAKMKLQPSPSFLTKCIELYDTILVRHGVMLVGKTAAGKSTALHVLADAITSLQGQEEYNEVDCYFFNPKAVTLDQLYGADDPNTHEWIDGVLPVAMRECVSDTQGRWKWVVFDGPVDALWIENMNTVLDDNKKLCLASGEIIKLRDHMNMVFELEDLAAASPATVSRCGMVFMEPSSLGFWPSVESWFAKLSPALQPLVSDFRLLFEWLVPSSLYCVQHYCKQPVPTMDIPLVHSLLKLFSSLLVDLTALLEKEADRRAAEIREQEEEAENAGINAADRPKQDPYAIFGPGNSQTSNNELYENIMTWCETAFVFSLIWSIGCSTDVTSRGRFSDFIREMTSSKSPSLFANDAIAQEKLKHQRKLRLSIPSGDHKEQVFDFVFQRRQPTTSSSSMDGEPVEKDNRKKPLHPSQCIVQWQLWMAADAQFQIPEGAKFHEIIVPTVDSTRIDWLIDVLLHNHHHILLTGPTGTGKSTAAVNKLLHHLDRQKWMALMLTFSARTSANQTQDIIDGKLERRRAGVLGPPPTKRCVVFVDDLNMPSKEQYGAQPPIEILRQWMDYNGWYDRKTNSFRKLEDIQFFAAMGPPGGGRNPITSRYTRHFNNICMNPYDDNSMKRIYGIILRSWMDNISVNVRSMNKSVVDATIALYNTISHELLPTPAKSHYTFNLRDVSKVFQGFMSVDNDYLKQPQDVLRLWIHECSRVFCDRLINQDDINWFRQLVSKQVQEHFRVRYEDVTNKDKSLIFCDFSNPKASKKSYAEVVDVEQLALTVENYQQDYNSVEKNQLDLVMFTSAVEHVARISRILRQPYGNALLVGVGGSGRQSLTRLAAFISDYDVFQVEITKQYDLNEWREDLRDVMRRAGVKNRPIVFLITDTQIKQEAFVEDINNILNNGEVPNLFSPEDYTAIIEAVLTDARKVNKADSNASIFSFFVDRVRTNIHIVLCLSPVGAAFRNRLRMFPALVNCTTIDWFHPWSTEALKQVASRFLREVNVDADVKSGIIDVCVDMQERVVQTTQAYLEEMRRYNYVTPASYLELIHIFQELFESKRTSIRDSASKYTNGLAKLKETELQVKTMQTQLENLKPQLQQSSKETAELMKTIEKRTLEVNQTKKVVSEEEKTCNEQAEAASKIRDECEEQLAEAMPALNQAMKALKVLKKSDLDELKATKVPTSGVLLTMEALCIMMNIEPNKVGEVGNKKNDYWEPAKKKLLNDPKFMDRLTTFDRDNISPAVMVKIRPFVKNPDFSPAKIAQASKAAEGFCKWILAMEVYDRVFKQVKPRKEALAEAEQTLQTAAEQLALKKQQLKEVQDMLDELNNQFEVVNQKKKTLEQQAKECSDRLERAEKLLGGLQGEKSRWAEKAQQLESDYNNVVGNILVASGVVAYLGVFTVQYRESCIKQWVRLLQQKNIPCDTNYSLSRVLGDPVQIREWGINALPKDSFSIDNAIIITNSRRWSLLIDPQEQAAAWLKKQESKENPLKIIKQSDDNFVRVLSMAVQVGLPVLIENVGETLDPALEPILLKQTFMQGSKMMIRLGSEVIPYNEEDFRLYITTKLQNPHYSPEVTTKVTLINFAVTPDGLQDQMLNFVVSMEESELEQQRQQLVVQNAQLQAGLQETESKILEQLNSSTGNILDNVDLIANLQKAKLDAKAAEAKLQKAAVTEENINKVRSSYQGVAFSSSNLWFCVSELSQIEPMYQYSLQWFMELYRRSIREADKSLDVHVRTNNIERYFLRTLYNNVCRSLFEKDKLLFSFLLCLRVLSGRQQLNQAELRFLLTGGSSSLNSNNKIRENPTSYDPNEPFEEEDDEEDEDDEDDEDDESSKSTKIEKKEATKPVTVAASPSSAASGSEKWLSDNSWQQIVALSELEAFHDLVDHIEANPRKWRSYCESIDPFSRSLPRPWERSLSVFQKLLILRCLRPDKATIGTQRVITSVLGKEFITPPPFDLQQAYQDSDPCVPIVFVLSPGVDPSKEVYKLAGELGGQNAQDKLIQVSLGQGQGPIAETAIREAVEKGTWVLLQNCHLAVSWMSTLQRIVEDLNPTTTHPEFRLWLTSMPSPHFPVSILQNGVKITNEPPKGIKANLGQSYRVIDDKFFEDSKRSDDLKKLLFGLCFFHAVVIERRKFGSLGWNILYEFNDSDLSISKTQLKLLIDEYDETPFKAMQYIVGQLNYGGRVTDDWDRRCLTHILQGFLSSPVLQEDCKFDSAGIYHVPFNTTDLQDYRSYIAELPKEEEADIFGLHPNAVITTAIKESNAMFFTLLALQPRTTSAGGKSREDVLMSLAGSILKEIPANFDIAFAQRKYPVVYSESMNTVLVQELVRFNRLLDVIRRSLIDLQRAIKGEVVMSVELENLANSMYDNVVPKLWAAVAYPSLKPLGAWVNDLKRRLKMFSDWLQNSAPKVFWISGFFFTQSFLTGSTQNYARKTRIPIDEISFDFQVMPNIDPNDPNVEPPNDGCYIYGLYLEGAQWDSQNDHLTEAAKRQLYAEMPVIWLKPTETSKIPTGRLQYRCPVYKTSKRAGTLSTTGHSTNFVLSIMLNSTLPESHWVKRGVALLCQLDN